VVKRHLNESSEGRGRRNNINVSLLGEGFWETVRGGGAEGC